MSKKFETELERFVTGRYEPHDELKGKLDKWSSENENGLNKLDKQIVSFENDLESKFGKLDNWLAKKQQELEKIVGE